MQIGSFDYILSLYACLKAIAKKKAGGGGGKEERRVTSASLPTPSPLTFFVLLTILCAFPTTWKPGKDNHRPIYGRRKF